MNTVRSPNMDGMPHGNGNHSTVEDAAIIHEKVMKAYSESIYELDAMRADLVSVVPMIKDEQKRGMITLRYLNGFSVPVIA